MWLNPIHYDESGTSEFGFRFRGYAVVPGSAIAIHNCNSRTHVTAIDAAHLTNPETRGIMAASVVFGANREIYLKCLRICGGAESAET